MHTHDEDNDDLPVGRILSRREVLKVMAGAERRPRCRLRRAQGGRKRVGRRRFLFTQPIGAG